MVQLFSNNHSKGPLHRHTLFSTINLAFAIQGQGRYDEAQALFYEVHKAQSETLGPKAVETIASLVNRAACFSAQVSVATAAIVNDDF